MAALYRSFANVFELIPYAVLALVARIAGAAPFWRSGQTKLEGAQFLGVKINPFDIAEKKIYLFQYEFGFPEAIAPMATRLAALGEFFLPVMLVFGILTRVSALGLLLMTAVIQFWVFPEELLKPNGNWSLHLLWAAPLLLVLARGPGAISVDALFNKQR